MSPRRRTAEPPEALRRIQREMIREAGARTVRWLGAVSGILMAVAVYLIYADHPFVGGILLAVSVLAGMFLLGALRSRRTLPPR